MITIFRSLMHTTFLLRATGMSHVAMYDVKVVNQVVIVMYVDVRDARIIVEP